MIQIDGSVGEGGGQILRTALALSMCSGKAFRIDNIRAKRKKPGLLRQHLTAVEAARTLCNGDASGAVISSRTIEFSPGKVNAGDYRFAVGTAGSATLVLQTVLPPLLGTDAQSVLRLEGGTHNPWAPPYHFIERAFLPILGQLGVTCASKLTRWGFFPAGGGMFEVRVFPSPTPGKPLDLTERGEFRRAEVLAGIAQIPWEVADDEAKAIVKTVRFPVGNARAEEVPSIGPGNVAMLEVEFDRSRTVFTGFGLLGVSRKAVAAEVTRQANRFFKSGVAVDQHLADQLLIPLALRGGGSFTTTEPTPHLTTNTEIVRIFLDTTITVTKLGDDSWKITVSPQDRP